MSATTTAPYESEYKALYENALAQAMQLLRENTELRKAIEALTAEREHLRDLLHGPRLLPDGVSECPTCGATTDKDAQILCAIERVTTWKARLPAGDTEGHTIFDAGLAELRATLTGDTAP